MSRRASLAKKASLVASQGVTAAGGDDPWQKAHGKQHVRFPDELVFLENIRDNDLELAGEMLRRASVQIDINGIAPSGLTPLHQACLDQNLKAVRLLVENGAYVNQLDDDTWTPLHAACEVGNVEIVKYLLENGADPTLKTCVNELPMDLVDTYAQKRIYEVLYPYYSAKKTIEKKKKKELKELKKAKKKEASKQNH